MKLVLAALCAASCAAPLQRTRAAHPVTAAELALYPLTVEDSALRASGPELERSLAAHGFKLVSHAPYQGDLLLTVRLEPDRTILELTSDGFFVDRLEAPFPLDPEAIASDLAQSDRMADFVRNSGTVQQRDISSP